MPESDDEIIILAEDHADDVPSASQYLQSLLGKEVQSGSFKTYLSAPQCAPAPGNELLKHRIRVSFDFDVTCNDAPIRNACADEQSTQYSLALLQSFLVADKESLLHMMVDTVATQMGYNGPETFIATFLPQICTESHKLFDKAIDGLSGDIGEHWRELRDDARDEYKDWFGYCTEELYECFNAKFVNSDFEVIGDNA